MLTLPRLKGLEFMFLCFCLVDAHVLKHDMYTNNDRPSYGDDSQLLRTSYNGGRQPQRRQNRTSASCTPTTATNQENDHSNTRKILAVSLTRPPMVLRHLFLPLPVSFPPPPASPTTATTKRGSTNVPKPSPNNAP